MMVYQIYKVCLALMYMKHKYMIYEKLYIYPYLVLDQNAKDNAYPIPCAKRFGIWTKK